MWVHDTREEEKKGIQIFEASHFFMEEKIEEIAKLPRGGGYENFSDPDKGKLLAWTRKGAGKENTQYLGHRFIEREYPIPDRILDQSFSLDQVVNMHPSYEELEKEFKGTLKKMKLLVGDDEDDIPFPSTGDDVPMWKDEDEEESSSRKRTTSRKKTRSSKDEDEEEDPTKRKRTVKRTVKRKVRR